MTSRSHRSFMVGIPAVILLAAVLAMVGVGFLGTWLAQEQLGEARAAKAAAVAEAVQHDLERAIGYGIPLPRIEGVGAFLQGIADRNPDIGYSFKGMDVIEAWVTADLSETGGIGNPHTAAPEKGARSFEAKVARLAELLEAVYRLPKRAIRKAEAPAGAVAGS